MKFSTTLKLLTAVLILAGVLWHLEIKLRPEVEVRKAPFESVSMDDVSYLFCRLGEMEVECSRKDRSWFMSYPVRARADTAVIARILSIAEGLTCLEMITAEQRMDRDLTLGDYGLKSPSMQVKIGGSYFLRDMHIGNAAPVGDAVYVKFADEDVVYSVPGAVTNIFPAKPELFRDPRILPGDSSKAVRIEIQQPGGFVQLVRKKGAWWIQQPFSAQADGAKIDSLLNILFSLQAAIYVWDPPVDEVTGEQVQQGALQDVYGFASDVSPVRITVWSNGDEIGKEIIFGKTISEDPGLIYARRKSFDSIFAVKRDLAPIDKLAASDLRDKLIFPLEPERVIELGIWQDDYRVILHKDHEQGWMITEPVKWQADDDYVSQLVSFLARLKVSEYRSTEGGGKLDSLGLDPPEFRISLSTEPCQQNPEDKSDAEKSGLRQCCSESVLFSAPGTNGIRNVSLPNGQLALMSNDWIGSVDAGDLTDPLQYRDRTVLALPATSIRSIDLETKEGKESIVLSSNGMWVCSSDPGRQVNSRVVGDILLFAANLRAEGFESLNPKNLSGYGLKPPSVSLTLGLSGEEGIQKTIMLGFKAGTDGIYGLIKGQDLLLTLNKKLAELLSRNLLLPRDSAVENAGSEKITAGSDNK